VAWAMGEPHGLDIVLVIESDLPDEAALSIGNGKRRGKTVSRSRCRYATAQSAGQPSLGRFRP
jgi:hypothetical protein